MEFLASDKGTPSRTSIPSKLTVTVLRNQFPPEFLNTPYSQRIDSTTSTASRIFQATARDNDTTVCTAALIDTIVLFFSYT